MMLVAVQPKRDHASGAPGQWWAEYRVREMSPDERNTERTYKYHYVLECRYCHDQDSEYCTHHDSEWRVFGYGATAEAAIADIDDTDYIEAISLDPLHAAFVRQWKRNQRISKARRILFNATHEEYFPRGNYREIDVEADERDQAEARFEHALKQARIYKAACEGKAPQAKVDAIKADIRAEFNRRLAERKRRHEAMLRKYHELERLLA